MVNINNISVLFHQDCTSFFLLKRRKFLLSRLLGCINILVVICLMTLILIQIGGYGLTPNCLIHAKRHASLGYEMFPAIRSLEWSKKMPYQSGISLAGAFMEFENHYPNLNSLPLRFGMPRNNSIAPNPSSTQSGQPTRRSSFGKHILCR